MMNLRKLTKLAVLVQAALWAVLLLIFFVILPSQGFSALADFNDPSKVAAVPLPMLVIVWSDLVFGLMTLVSVWALFLHLRTRLPLVVNGAATIVLIGVVAWFIAHDVGFHLIGWSDIERDPASTNYAMDRLLWAVRNGVFCAMGGLTYLAVASANRPGLTGSTGRQLANSS